MKQKSKLTLFSGIILLLVIIISSCKKENEVLTPSQSGNNHFLKTIDHFPYVSAQNGILEFNSMQEVIDVIDSLEADIVYHNEDFVSQYSSLSMDSLNSMAYIDEFDDEYPFEDFEDNFSYTSLRSIITTEEREWLDDDGEYIEDDPSEHFVALKSVMTILNQYCEIKIEDYYYKMTDSGYYKIDNDLTSLEILRESTIDTTQYETVSFHRTASEEDCRSTKWDSDFEYHNTFPNLYRTKWRLGHITLPWSRYMYAATINYSKKNVWWSSNGKWRKQHGYCYAAVWGYISDVVDGNADCSATVGINCGGLGYTCASQSASAAISAIHKIKVATKIKSGWVNGIHDGLNNYVYTASLTW